LGEREERVKEYKRKRQNRINASVIIIEGDGKERPKTAMMVERAPEVAFKKYGGGKTP
jgi:hypothetical protein